MNHLEIIHIVPTLHEAKFGNHHTRPYKCNFNNCISSDIV
jgi:hypothetical protein